MHYRGAVWILAGALTLASYRRVGQAFLFGAVASIPICVVWCINYGLTGTLMGNRSPSDVGVVQTFGQWVDVMDGWVMQIGLGYAFALLALYLVQRLYGRQPQPGRIQLSDGFRRTNAFNLRRVLDYFRRTVGMVVLVLALSGCEGYLTPNGGYALDISIRIAPPAAVPTLTPTRTPTFAPTVQPTETPEPTPTKESATFIPDTPLPPLEGRVIASALNVRRCPSTETIDCVADHKIFQGQVVHITGRTEDSTWLQIEVPGTLIQGWVSARWIEMDHG